MKCPKCDKELVKEEIVHIRGNNKIEVVGYNLFCMNRICDFEKEM